ncbi:hypothetical protein EJV46_11830 [Roseococcus sp. SYP-B2431]|uniref:PIN-like domain-containing protein n=1 Tax=Roseococcus sp. SYP-B2431 TaxID=2496640 RepID=UPI00103B030D|nr:hypothetical protein [Roseococcus sp. SYP-B2431]TCH97904.1 hypothetical protein EJV46_11830 [Roseococcus sp. SYP-B2431]
MRVFFDHNLPPALARAMNELFQPEHEARALREKFPANVSDVEWITELSRDGRWVVISGDRRITRNRAEQAAFRNSRLIGMFLAPALCRAPVAKQAERILALWPSIEILANTVAGGAMFEMPMTSTRPRQIR